MAFVCWLAVRLGQVDYQRFRCWLSPIPVESFGVRVDRRVVAGPDQFHRTMQALDEFAASLRYGQPNKQKRWQQMLVSIAEINVGDRPGRTEPRELKRRKKSYKRMTTPRRSTRNPEVTAA